MLAGGRDAGLAHLFAATAPIGPASHEHPGRRPRFAPPRRHRRLVRQQRERRRAGRALRPQDLGLIAAPLRLLHTELGLVIALSQIEMPLMLLPLIHAAALNSLIVAASATTGVSAVLGTLAALAIARRRSWWAQAL